MRGGRQPAELPTSTSADAQTTRAYVRRSLTRPAGGFDAQLSDIERVAAHHANNYMPLVYRQLSRDRATMFAFAGTVELEATSADRSLLDALDHALAHQRLTRGLIPDHQ
jgi:hypothetical protein